MFAVSMKLTDYAIVIHNLSSYQQISNISSAHPDQIIQMSKMFGVNTTYLLSVSESQANCWDLQTNAKVTFFSSYVAAIYISGLTNGLVALAYRYTSDGNYYVSFFYPNSSTEVDKITLPGNPSALGQIGSNLLGVGMLNGTIFGYDVYNSHQVVFSFNQHANRIVKMQLYQTNITISADTAYIIMWNWRTQSQLSSVIPSACTISDFDITTSNQLVVACRGLTIIRYDITSNGIGNMNLGLISSYSVYSVFARFPVAGKSLFLLYLLFCYLSKFYSSKLRILPDIQ